VLLVRARNVDLSSRRVFVRERFYRGDWNEPKSEFGVRDVPITEAMAEALGARWRKERPASGEALVFGSANGTPLNVANVYNRVFKKAAREAGVPWATFHTLRHTCGTMLRRQGYTAEQVQLFLGHHAASFTSDVYVHFDADDIPAPDFMDGVTRTSAADNDPSTANRRA
jgi:integrase